MATEAPTCGFAVRDGRNVLGRSSQTEQWHVARYTHSHSPALTLKVSCRVGWRQVMIVQYWHSFEDLENFAR